MAAGCSRMEQLDDAHSLAFDGWIARKQDRSYTLSDCILRVCEQGSGRKKAASDARRHRLQLQNQKRSHTS